MSTSPTTHTGYTIKAEAPVIYWQSRPGNKRPQWIPTQDQHKAARLLDALAGKTFASIPSGAEGITGGVSGAVYLLMDESAAGHIKSPVLAIGAEYLTPVTLDGPAPAVPVEVASRGGWWTAQGLDVVRIASLGWTDGFMAFTTYQEPEAAPVAEGHALPGFVAEDPASYGARVAPAPARPYVPKGGHPSQITTPQHGQTYRVIFKYLPPNIKQAGRYTVATIDPNPADQGADLFSFVGFAQGLLYRRDSLTFYPAE